jgi:hypothetical protein
MEPNDAAGRAEPPHVLRFTTPPKLSPRRSRLTPGARELLSDEELAAALSLPLQRLVQSSDEVFRSLVRGDRASFASACERLLSRCKLLLGTEDPAGFHPNLL